MTDLTDNHKQSYTAGVYPAMMLKKTMDCAASNKTQNQVDNLFTCLAGDVVLNVSAEVETIEADTLTFDVGDGVAANGYIDGANGESTGWNSEGNTVLGTMASNATTLTSTAVGYGMGTKLYTDGDTIDVTWLNAADTAKVTFRAVIIRGG